METLLANEAQLVRYRLPDSDIPARDMEDLEATLRREVAYRLAVTRKLIDQNRTRLAERYGVHHTVWQKWEEGRNLPSEAVMVMFCNETDVTMDWIYRGVMTGLPQSLIVLLQHVMPGYQATRLMPPPRAEDMPSNAPPEPRQASRPAQVHQSFWPKEPQPPRTGRRRKKAGAN